MRSNLGFVLVISIIAAIALLSAGLAAFHLGFLGQSSSGPVGPTRLTGVRKGVGEEKLAEATAPQGEGPIQAIGFAGGEKELELRFVVMGDTRPASASAPQTAVFKHIFRLAQSFEPDLIFIVGDVVYGGTSDERVLRRQYEDFLAATKDHKGRLIVAPGNHDVPNSVAVDVFRDSLLQPLYFSFTLNSCQFIILDTEERQTMTAEQVSWLRRELSVSKGAGPSEIKHRFIFMHRPLISFLGRKGKGGEGRSFGNEQLREELVDLIARSGVDAVFAGHEHLFNYNRADGVDYFITGCAGAFPYVEPEEGGFWHFLLAEVRKDGARYRLFNSRGQQLDFEDYSQVRLTPGACYAR